MPLDGDYRGKKERTDPWTRKGYSSEKKRKEGPVQGMEVDQTGEALARKKVFSSGEAKPSV
jgi:hypothetical protein